MITRTRAVYVSMFAAAAAFAWQGGLAAVGWADAEAPKIAEAYFSGDYDGLPGINFLSGPMRKQWLARGGADRAAAVRDLALYAKRFVSSPNFEKMYDGWIRGHFSAVNHGIKTDAAPPVSEAQAGQMQNAMIGNIVQMFGQLDPSMIRIMFDNDVSGWKDSDGADEKKWLARAKQIEPLQKSNPAEFKKQYILLKSASMGGPSTEAGLSAATSKGAEMAAGAKQREEQANYDQHRLRVVLKKRLADFVQVARSVDFAAQTRTVNGKQIFVNADYERKSDLWKKLYRLGREPSTAALGVAEQWLKEL